MSEIIREKRYRPSKFTKAYWRVRNKIRDIIEPIWYRFFGHKHHLVRTKLTPHPWYDTNIRMLYGVMGLVEWFVENDMRIWTQKDRDEEFARIESEDGEYKEGNIECLKNQLAHDDKIIEICKWWKNYPIREKEVEKSLHDWAKYGEKFMKDPEDLFSKKKPMTEEEQKEERRLLDYHTELEKKLQDEETEYLKLAVELKEYMWS